MVHEEYVVKEPDNRKCARCAGPLDVKTIRVVVYVWVDGQVSGVGFLCGDC